MDASAANLFLKILRTADAPPREYLLAISDRDDKTRAPREIWLDGLIDDPTQDLIDQLQDDEYRGIFAATGSTDGHGRSAEHIECQRALVIDFDKGTPDLPQGWPEPSMRVHSKRGEHWYWLTRCNDKRAWRAAQLALAKRLGGDHQVALWTQVMRLPGTQHIKRDPHPVTLTIGPPKVWCFDKLIKALGVERDVVQSIRPVEQKPSLITA